MDFMEIVKKIQEISLVNFQDITLFGKFSRKLRKFSGGISLEMCPPPPSPLRFWFTYIIEFEEHLGKCWGMNTFFVHFYKNFEYKLKF